tara:strand:- start:2438 stop:3385 length:948 start_codon:yes stop_codon:yes gene_type:complete
MIKGYLLFFFSGLIFLLCLQACKQDNAPPECDLINQLVSIDSLQIENKVLLIGIDGFRSDAMTEEITPYLFQLFSAVNCYKNLTHSTEEDTYSGPNWSSILTGVHYNKHNVIDNSFEGSRFDFYPSFFNYLKRFIPSMKTASIVNWLPINQEILFGDVDYAPIISSNDSLVFERAKDLLVNSSPIKPDVLFLHFDELDMVGHNFGFSPTTPEYIQTLAVLDSYLESLMGIINDKRLSGENWLYIVVSDHGGDGTSHGDSSNPKINQTVLFVEHPLLSFRTDYVSNQTDIVPTIFDYIGLSSSEFDCKKDGLSILE